MTFTFENFEMRRRAIAFADGMIGVADTLPEKLQLSLRERLRRAALSIPANLARGSGCDSAQERSDYYRLAEGSVHEVVSLLGTIGERGHLNSEVYRQLRDEADNIAAMISGAMKWTQSEETEEEPKADDEIT